MEFDEPFDSTGYINPRWSDPEILRADLEAALSEMERDGITSGMPYTVVHGTDSEASNG